MAVLKNRAKMSTSTTGTGTITLGSPESGYQSFADAGVANADVVRYVIEDTGGAFEIGTGTYTATGTTLSRTVSESSNSDAAINLSGSATVFIGATAEDIQNFVASTGTATAPNDNVSIAIGGQAVASGTNSISLQRANSSGTDSIAAIVGNTTTSYGAQGGNTISMGALSKATALAGTAVGYGATSTHTGSSAFGTSATTTANSQVALGGSGYTVRISGAYNLPTSDGTNGQVLTTNGSGAVTFADAGGGGGADLYIANPVSATDPTAGGDNAVGIGDGADATGNDSIAIGTDTIAGLESVAIGYNAASGTTTGSRNTSIGRSAAIYLTTGSNNTAVGRSALQGSNLDKVTGSDNTAVGNGAGSKNAGGNNNTYLGTNAGNAITSGSSNTFIGYNADGAATTSQQTALGYQAETAGTGATAINNSYASGTDSFAAAIATNSSSYGASGANSIAIGKNAKATAQEAVCISNTSTASGSNAAVLGGASGTASGSGSVALGGSSNVADGVYSTAKGYYGNANGIRLKHATGVYPNQQGAYYVLGYTTSDATPIALNTSVWTPSSTNQIVLPNNSAFAFHGTIVARQQAADGTACAAWRVEGLIRREGSAGTTVLVNSATTVLDNTPSWGMALSADTTNGCLKIQATGAASTDIRWVASVTTSEVTYA